MAGEDKMTNDFLIRFLKETAKIMNQNREYLIELDSVVGDGDLGLTMGDGYQAAYDAVKDSGETDAGRLLYNAGKAMSIKVPSTMGTLMASGFMQAGKSLKGKKMLTNVDIVQLFSEYEAGVKNRGKAEIGDKTFLDGVDPAVKTLSEKIGMGMTLKEAAEAAVAAAENGFESTATMVAVHGRAATRGEASRALKDPGAAVALLFMQAFSNALL
jgi:dihydroxyacetone kinase-like protein